MFLYPGHTTSLVLLVQLQRPQLHNDECGAVSDNSPESVDEHRDDGEPGEDD